MPVPSHTNEQSCICELRVSILSLSTILILDSVTVPTVWCSCFNLFNKQVHPLDALSIFYTDNSEMYDYFILQPKLITYILRCYYYIIVFSCGNCSHIVFCCEVYCPSQRRRHYTSSDNNIRTLFPRENIIICLVHGISFCCVEVNSSAFTSPNLAMLTT
jgi:hypothetical protein